jgi:thymidylate synthase
MLKPIFIEATTLPDAWFQALYKCVENGREFIINKGSYAGQKRLEFDFITIHIKKPDAGTKGEIAPLLPKMNPLLGFPDPVDENYINDYLPYLMTGEEKEGESYTYGQRMMKCYIKSFTKFNNLNIPNIDDFIHYDNGYYFDQIEIAIYNFKNKGHRSNQEILKICHPNDSILNDPACLQIIDLRIQDGKLHFFPYFRSWDLFGGFPANLAAIELMKQYMADEIGVENGEIIASSKGLHLYNYVWEIAEAIRGKSMKEFREENKRINI